MKARLGFAVLLAATMNAHALSVSNAVYLSDTYPQFHIVARVQNTTAQKVYFFEKAGDTKPINMTGRSVLYKYSNGSDPNSTDPLAFRTITGVVSTAYVTFTPSMTEFGTVIDDGYATFLVSSGTTERVTFAQGQHTTLPAPEISSTTAFSGKTMVDWSIFEYTNVYLYGHILVRFGVTNSVSTNATGAVVYTIGNAPQATATNVSMSDLTDTMTLNNIPVGNGTNLVLKTPAEVRTVLGIGSAGTNDASSFATAAEGDTATNVLALLATETNRAIQAEAALVPTNRTWTINGVAYSMDSNHVITVTATNLALADLTDTFGTNYFVIGTGSNAVIVAPAAARTAMGLGTAATNPATAFLKPGDTNGWETGSHATFLTAETDALIKQYLGYSDFDANNYTPPLVTFTNQVRLAYLYLGTVQAANRVHHRGDNDGRYVQQTDAAYTNALALSGTAVQPTDPAYTNALALATAALQPADTNGAEWGSHAGFGDYSSHTNDLTNPHKVTADQAEAVSMYGGVVHGSLTVVLTDTNTLTLSGAGVAAANDTYGWDGSGEGYWTNAAGTMRINGREAWARVYQVYPGENYYECVTWPRVWNLMTNIEDVGYGVLPNPVGEFAYEADPSVVTSTGLVAQAITLGGDTRTAWPEPGAGGDWWTNAPTSAITYPTNAWQAGYFLSSDDGTNFYWVAGEAGPQGETGTVDYAAMTNIVNDALIARNVTNQARRVAENLVSAATVYLSDAKWQFLTLTNASVNILWTNSVLDEIVLTLIAGTNNWLMTNVVWTLPSPDGLTNTISLYPKVGGGYIAVGGASE